MIGRTRSRAGKVNTTVLFAGMLLVIPLVAILASGFGKDPRALPSMLEQRPAPSFALVDLEGKRWDLAELRGKPVVLNFWSTWCGPCKFEHPLLLKAAEAYPQVIFLGVIYQDEADKVVRYLKTAGTAYPHLVDDGSRIAIDYGVTGVPETFFIDKNGVIAFKSTGPLMPQVLREKLDEISR